jgi:hypothetical protein
MRFSPCFSVRKVRVKRVMRVKPPSVGESVTVKLYLRHKAPYIGVRADTQRDGCTMTGEPVKTEILRRGGLTVIQECSQWTDFSFHVWLPV